MELIGKTDLLTVVKRAQTTAGSELSKLSKKSSDIAADWLSVYTGMYPQEEMTPELAMAYREGLKELSPKRLHAAFLKAMQDSPSGRRGFRPSVGEICEAADQIVLNEHRGTRAKDDCTNCHGGGFRPHDPGNVYVVCECTKSA